MRVYPAYPGNRDKHWEEIAGKNIVSKAADKCYEEELVPC